MDCKTHYGSTVSIHTYLDIVDAQTCASDWKKLDAIGDVTITKKLSRFNETYYEVYVQSKTCLFCKQHVVFSHDILVETELKNPAAVALGSIKSEAKTAANRENAKRPRPNAQGKKKPRKPKPE